MKGPKIKLKSGEFQGIKIINSDNGIMILHADKCSVTLIMKTAVYAIQIRKLL